MSVFSSVIPTRFVPRTNGKILETSPDQLHGNLTQRQMIALKGNHQYRLIICHQGMLWITQQNDAEDYVLHAGESFLITLPGRVLIQALEESILDISTQLTMPPSKGIPELSP